MQNPEARRRTEIELAEEIFDVHKLREIQVGDSDGVETVRKCVWCLTLWPCRKAAWAIDRSREHRVKPDDARPSASDLDRAASQREAAAPADPAVERRSPGQPRSEASRSAFAVQSCERYRSVRFADPHGFHKLHAKPTGILTLRSHDHFRQRHAAGCVELMYKDAVAGGIDHGRRRGGTRWQISGHATKSSLRGARPADDTIDRQEPAADRVEAGTGIHNLAWIGLPETIDPQSGAWPAEHAAICYIRADSVTLARPLAIAADQCALAHRHAVIAQFRDSLNGRADGRRPGLEQCLRALSTGDATAVVVPTVGHLAAPGRLRAWVIQQIQALGGLLLVASPDPTPDPGLTPVSAHLSPFRAQRPI